MRLLLLHVVLLLSMPAWAQEIRELSWSEMVPQGSMPAEIPMAIHEAGEEAPAAIQQLPNAPVVPELTGAWVKLPGYIVPLETDSNGRVIEFFLVPYFGACIHVPPPPSNQIVHVSSEPGVVQEALYQPYWIEGRLKVELSRHELTTAGYAMQAEKIYVYELPEGN
ncbi:DUF3299 domain-containing protein [Azomonas macrocytogenes]|nr:DUF3299 domain-containing protein [Azomonas macrocytogenes]